MIRILLAFCTLVPCVVTCPYPSDLIGEWYSTSFGTLTFTTNTFSGFTATGVSATPLTFTCYGVEGSQYVSQSSVVAFGSNTIAIYLCMNLQKITDIKYSFTMDSNLDITGVRFLSSTSFSISVAEACTVTDTRSPGEYELLVLKSSIADAVVPCPNSFASFFTINMTTSTSTGCENSTMDGSTSGLLSFNYSSCASGLLSSGGHLQCLHYIVSGNGYLIAYNNDSTTDETSTFQFTCFTYYKTAASLLTTEHPRSCHTNQSTTYVPSPGITYAMTDVYYEGPDVKEVNLALILGVLFGTLGGIIIIIIIIVLCVKFCKKKPEPPPPPPIRKKKRKLSITDYSPNLSARSVGDEKRLIKKQSTGLILAGTATNERKMLNIDEDVGYEPPKKEKWQKVWENKSLPGTPGKPVSVEGRVVHSSQNGYVRQDSGSLAKKSVSLPEGLDQQPRKSSTIDDLKIEALDLETSRPSSRYSNRSYSSPRLPESTGKFGGENTFRSDGTVFMPSNLQTIRENPLSRDATALSIENVPKTPKTVSTSFPPRAVSSITGSHSTVSAGDVRLNTLSKLSRYSHLSASNESIFDDPGWLTKGATVSEKAFEIGKNLLPGLPKKSMMDQRAFLKVPVVSQQSREDLDYMRSKSKTMQSVGIKASMGSHMTERSSSSQKIIEYEKKKRRKKGETSKPKISWIYKWEHVLRPTSPFRSIVNKRRPTVTPSEDCETTSSRASQRHLDNDSDSDMNTSRTSLTPSPTVRRPRSAPPGRASPTLSNAKRPSIGRGTRRPKSATRRASLTPSVRSLGAASLYENRRSATPSPVPGIVVTSPNELTPSIADSVSLANTEDTISIENEISQRIGRKRKRKRQTREVNINLDLITARHDDGTVSRLSTTSDGRSLGSIKLLIVNENTEEEIEHSEIIPERVPTPNGQAVFRIRTNEDVDAISMSVRSNISVDEVTVDESIASSMYSDVFFPDDWLFMYSEQDVVQQLWRQGSKRMSKKRKQEFKCWMKANDFEDRRRKKTKPITS